ncbi:hypothetical protein SAMN05421763_10377 [[Luteovulum] sphaeroides subsp. megalophilum]|nr:hypothetical protein SAMN05421763_10377 [[Luteovulum] sphaeroides subsp. megalophilum]
MDGGAGGSDAAVGFGREVDGGEPNFEVFRRILRDHVVETSPLGPGDELMGEPVTVRHLHSVRTAAKETGIDQRRMRRMLAAAGIVPEAAEGTCDGWETFDAAAAQPILDDLTALMAAYPILSDAHALDLLQILITMTRREADMALWSRDRSGCPVCLRADAVGSGAPPHIAMALRGHWLVPHVTLCLDHHHPLVPLWRDPQPGSRNDSVARFREIADEILAGRLDQETREPTDFDLWIDARLSGTAQVNWLDAQPLHAAATFCHILGTALLRLEQVLPAWVRRSDRWALYQMGFEVASQGEEAIRSALRRLQKLADGPQDGPKKVFPLLYDRLSHDYRDDPNFEAFRRILRDHMVETWPLGPGDELMGEPVTERRLHSVRTAAQATGIDQRRMRRMLAAAGIVPEAAEGTCDAWETFGAAAARRSSMT